MSDDLCFLNITLQINPSITTTSIRKLRSTTYQSNGLLLCRTVKTVKLNTNFVQVLVLSKDALTCLISAHSVYSMCNVQRSWWRIIPMYQLHSSAPVNIFSCVGATPTALGGAAKKWWEVWEVNALCKSLMNDE